MSMASNFIRDSKNKSSNGGEAFIKEPLDLQLEVHSSLSESAVNSFKNLHIALCNNRLELAHRILSEPAAQVATQPIATEQLAPVVTSSEPIEQSDIDKARNNVYALFPSTEEQEKDHGQTAA